MANEFIKYLDVDRYDSFGCGMRFGFLYLDFDGMSTKSRKKGHDFDGGVYILSSVDTFSSAMDFTMLIQDNGIGKVIGEPCGNLPSSYGETSSFALPNSHIYIFRYPPKNGTE